MPQAYLGNVINLCIEKRGVQKNMQYAGGQVSLNYELPLSEVVLDFFDRLKSVSRGYASFDYEFLRFDPSPLVKLDVLINGEKVDALSIIVHRDLSHESRPRSGGKNEGIDSEANVRSGYSGGYRRENYCPLHR